MAGWHKFGLGIALLLMGNSNLPEMTDKVGDQIYSDGRGADTINVSFPTTRTKVAGSAFPCASCHGEDGLGGKEGSIEAPPLVRARQMSAAMVEKWLKAAFVERRSAEGRELGAAMPSYTMSRRDMAALAAYVRTLPYPVLRGIRPDRIAIGIDPSGAGLSPKDLQLLNTAMLDRVARFNAAGGSFGRLVSLAGLKDRNIFGQVSWNPLGNDETPLPLSVMSGANVNCGSLFPTTEEVEEAMSANPAKARLVLPADMDRLMPLSNTFLTQGAASPSSALRIALLADGLDTILHTLGRSGRRISPKKICEDLRTSTLTRHAITIEVDEAILVQPLNDRK